MSTAPKGMIPSWDLSDLYSSIDDSALDETLDIQIKRAKEFQKRYRGKLNSSDLTASKLQSMLTEYENILQESHKPLNFASLVFSADTTNPQHGALLQRLRERSTEISVLLLFFEIELLEAPDEIINPLLSDPIMAQYKHFVESTRLFAKHHLSEPEERILEEKANTGARAFSRLFTETVSSIQFKMVQDGEQQVLSEQEILALLRDPNRDVRKNAAEALTNGLSENSKVLTFIFNTLIQDKAVDDRLRGYETPEQARHISNELSPDTVETVVTTATENYSLVARYYNLKKEILGYDQLWHYDRYAPLFDTKKTVNFEQARSIILESFGAFSPVMADTADKFFGGSWIDAEVRPGKRGGAFCSYITPDLHPYVLVNYLNRLDDVMTLGHELGHGVHAFLSRRQSYLNYHGTLPVAELASTFGEMLVFERLQKEADLQDRLALYAEKIEGVFATVFRQAAMYRFEQDIHTKRRESGEMTVDQYSELWQKRIQEMFGDSVNLGDDHRFWWLYVSHFIGSPFYVYAYTFGELLVLSLYARYKQEGAPFAPHYIDLLKQGGSLSPADLLSKINIDITNADFWRGGIEVLAGLVEQFEKLYQEWKS